MLVAKSHLWFPDNLDSDARLQYCVYFDTGVTRFQSDSELCFKTSIHLLIKTKNKGFCPESSQIKLILIIGLRFDINSTGY